MIEFTIEEKAIADKIIKLKKEAGSHSPSIFTYKQKLPEVNITVDACFLSNPYATELFLKYFNEEMLSTGKIRDLLEFYPSQNSVIAELLADFLKIKPQNIFIGNGAIEVIQAVIHNFTHSRILINIPTFSSYYEYARQDVTVIYNVLKKENDYALDIDQYIELVKKESPDTIVLINPNNPNGGYINGSDLERVCKELSFVETVILDESFIHFAYEDDSFNMVSMAKLINEHPNIVVLKSMSKDFGIAGIRVGYGIMSEARVHQLLNNGYLWNSNGLAEYFFRLYTSTDFAYAYNQVRIQYILETQEFIKSLKNINGIRVYPSKANFVLVELPEGILSEELVALMLIRYGVYVRTCDDKIGLEGQYIRLASRSKEENKFIIQAFKNFFGSNQMELISEGEASDTFGN